MARFSLKDMVVEADGNALGGVTNLTIEETAPTSDSTAAGDAAQQHVIGIYGWTAAITMRADWAAGANQTLRAGDSVVISGYAEGDGSGKKYYTGTVTITGHKTPGGSFDSTAEREYQGTGNGALSEATVA